MTEPVDEKTLDKLRKLMAHRDSAEAIGNQQEAEAFAERVQWLLNKHKLEEADVKDHFEEKQKVGSERVDFGEYGLPKKKYRVAWTERLASVIADNYFCKILIDPGSNTVYFAGKPTDREVAVFVYITLARAAIKMADRLHKKKELVRHLLDEPLDLRNFRESFYRGFIDGISERLKAMREQFTSENPGFALILVKSTEEIDLWMKFNSAPAEGSTARGGRSDNDLGYAAGKEYAREVPIQTGVNAKTQKRLN